MKPGLAIAASAGMLLLGGCVALPQGPSVLVMPGAGKGLEQFRADAGACQRFAQSSLGGAGQAAQDNAAANVVGGAAVGAAAGALLGASTGQAGYGAAWGAGTGMLVGGAAAGSYGAASSYALQRQYDNAYLQCMYTQGNQVPARVAPRTVSSVSVPPRARYSVPPNAITPPPNTPAPPGYAAPATYGAPRNALTPPPNTPAPPGAPAPGPN